VAVTVLDLTAFADIGVLTPADGPDAAKAFYDRWGFAVLRGYVGAELIDAMEAECVAAQQGVLAGDGDGLREERGALRADRTSGM
jgi:hypothetical protein